MNSTATSTAPAWVHDLTFIAAIALPEAWVDEFGTTINGMWADPDRWTPEAVASAHAVGRRILVSVPLIALTHQVYEKAETTALLDEVCRDIEGNPAEVEWYYWDAKPVYAMCVHSPALRTYLVDRLRPAIAAGVDVVNVDEINTSVGLMTRRAKGSGFCTRCLRGSSAIQAEAGRRGVAEPPDDMVRSWLRDDDDFYEAFAAEQRARAFREAADLLDELRSIARAHGQTVAITANVAGLGSFVGVHGPLWSAMWGELLDVIMLEAIYVSRSQFEDPHAHRLLPRGTFAPLYRLGRALGPRAPIWIAPQINVPRQLAGQLRRRYYELMFLEAYSNLGRWGYNWWPGVDELTRREATAPDAIIRWTAFMRDHPDLYTHVRTANTIAVVYSNAAVLADPPSHDRYLGLAQALYEAGVQFDVIYTGDDEFAAAPLDAASLMGYEQLLVPSLDHVTPWQREALNAYERRGGVVTAITGGQPVGRLVDRFWAEYRDDDRADLLTALHLSPDASITTSSSRVVATRYVTEDGRFLVHLLNYDYRADDDRVEPATDLVVSIPWTRGAPARVTLTSPHGVVAVPAYVHAGRVEIGVGDLEDHAVMEIVTGETDAG